MGLNEVKVSVLGRFLSSLTFVRLVSVVIRMGSTRPDTPTGPMCPPKTCSNCETGYQVRFSVDVQMVRKSGMSFRDVL